MNIRIRHYKIRSASALRPIYHVWFGERGITVQLGFHVWDLWYR